jgi:hypothetical protein
MGRTAVRARGLALVATAAAACGGEAPSFFDDPTQPLPSTLSELGLHPDAPPPDVLRAYEPSWPLWSNGSAKARLAFVPDPIDTAIADAWTFPIGTMFVKTFSYARDPESVRPIETRVLRLLDTGWAYDAYLWTEDGSDAQLIDLEESVLVDVIDDRGPLQHRVPNRLDCRTCHESAVQPVLGFSELQLDDAELAALDDDGLRTSPSTTPDRVRHDDPTTQDILGLFHGNCVHCHNGGTGVSASFDLRHQVALANTLDQPTASSASASGIRIVPGDPDLSILYLGFSGETEDPGIKPMPPLGVDRRDAEAIAVLRAWIEALPASDRRSVTRQARYDGAWWLAGGSY